MCNNFILCAVHVLHFKSLYHLFSQPINDTIDALKKKGKCRHVDADMASRILITGIAHSAGMYNANFIQCSKNELALNLAKFIFRFLNYSGLP